MRLADEVLSRWAPIIERVDLVTGGTGRFEVTLDGELIFSKSEQKRHAEPGEVTALLERRIGRPLDWRAK